MENLQTHIAADGLMITTTTLEKRGHRDDNRAAAETQWFQTCSSHESPSRTGAVGWSGVVPEEGQQREKKGVALGRQTFDGGFFLLCTSVLEPRPPLLPRSRSLQKVSHQHGSARAFRDPIAVLFLTLDLNERGSTVTVPLPPAGQFHGRVVVVVGFCLFPGRPFKAEHGKTNGLICKNLTDRLMALGISVLLQVLMQCRAAAA